MESQSLKALFISDTHFAPHSAARLSLLHKCVMQEKPDKLFLLGDIFDRWVGWDIYPDFTKLVERQFSEIASVCTIYYMNGNHDRLIKPHDMAKISANWLNDPSIIQLGSNNIYLTHGDKLCTQDRLLNWFTPFHDSQIVNFLFLKLPLKWRQAVATSSKSISKKNRSTFQLDKIELNLDLVASELQNNQAEYMIHGHTHRPMFHKDQNRFTLGAWDHSQIAYLKFDNGFTYAHIDASKESILT